MAVFGLLSLQVLVPRQYGCVCHSVNMEWGVKENHVAVIALHNWGKSFSQIFELLKPLKILRMFVGLPVKRYKELWRVEDWARSGGLNSVRAEATIKTVWERIHQNLLWKQKIISRPNVAPHEGLSTHESLSPLKGTHPYSHFEGDLMDKSRAAPPVSGREWARKHLLYR